MVRRVSSIASSTVLGILVALYGVALQAADVTARVDRSTMALNESFTLLIEAVGDVEGTPDFSVLQPDFEVRVQSESQNIQIVNGQYSRAHQWRLTLFPRRVGRLEIPEIAIGAAHTPSLAIEVTEAGEGGDDSDAGNLILEVDVVPETAYIQSQLIYRVRLYRSAETRLGRVEDPVVRTGEAIVGAMGDSRTFQTTRGGRRYDVVERRFLVSPQSSGRLEFAPVTAEAIVIEPLGLGGQHQRLTSEAIALDVRPIPPGFQGDWLPARSLRLFEEWGREPDELRAGEPITRTVTLVADGLIASQLPEIGAGVAAGLKQYPDRPTLNNQDGGDAVVGIRQESAAIIPTAAGAYTLPPVEVTWWNTETGRAETATLPGRTLTVLPGTAIAPDAPAESVSVAQAPVPGGDPPRSPWPWLAGIALTGWFVTGLLWWVRSRRAPSEMRSGDSPSAEDVPAARLVREFRSACEANDHRRARQLLVDWSTQLGLPAPGLSHLAMLLDDDLAAEIERLDRSLYGRERDAWNGAGLAERVAEVFAVTPRRRPETEAALPPLYPVHQESA